MIDRYTLPEMGAVWSTQNKFECLLQVEKAVAQVQGRLGIIPTGAADNISKCSKFSVARILEIEKTTKHDVIAFVTNVAESLGPDGRFVHFGMTSSDVLDTALSLQIRSAEKILQSKLQALEEAFNSQIKKHQDTLSVGRTHGIHAEPTTFGFKMAGFLAELKRNRARVFAACAQASRVKLSGAVGTYSAMPIEVEEQVAADLGMTCEDIATQVIPRDRYAEVFNALAILGAGFERVAIEIRHLQRTEVDEVQESFEVGQKGSSAMPHKKNPIASENITGMARLLRSYAVAALENVALWHERDISHSAVERVIFPDAFILADYSASRLTQVIQNLKVNSEVMKKNLELTRGQIFSSHVLLELIKKGLSREDAYKMIQKASHSLKVGEHLSEVLAKDEEVSKYLSEAELSGIFSGEAHKKNIQQVIERVRRL